MSRCRQGCRLNALRLFQSEGVLDVTGRLTVHGLAGSGAATPFAARQWRATAGGRLASTPDGMRVDITSLHGLPDGMVVQPADTPYPLPAATAGPAPGSVATGLDGRPLPVRPVLRIPAVPGVGAPGTIVDLDYADRLALDAAPTGAGRVWLSAAAPDDAVSRLRAHGLVIAGDVTADGVRRQLDAQGSALALWFYALIAGLATALAAGVLVLAATVDRIRHVDDLSALRHQGLPPGAMRQATLWTYPALTTVATVCGLAIGLAGWGLTGWALPLAGLDPPPLPLPGWPRAATMAALGVAVAVVLAAVAYLAGRRTLRLIR
jgi:putative ABC transport system permease protein